MSSPPTSARVGRIRASKTIAVNTKAKELKAAGKDVINLSTGEPDFDTPEHVKEAARKAMADGDTKYTMVPGTVELREAVCRKFARDNKLNFSPDQIVASNGAKHALMNLGLATIDDGDEVIIFTPCWGSYVEIINFCGGVVRSLDAPASENYKVSAEKLSEAITPKTKMVMINSPNNPTGSVYSAEELKAFGEVIGEHPDLMVCIDDIYEHIVYDIEAPATSFATVNPDLLDRTIIINGVSKAYAMTGWRLGFSASSAKLAKAMSAIQSHTTSSVCTIAQAAAIAALDSNLDCLKPMLDAFSARRARVIEALTSIDKVVLPPIHGAFYAYPQLQEAIDRLHGQGKLEEANDIALASYLLDCGVAIVPSSAFETTGGFRMSFAAEDSLIDKALEIIGSALS